MWVWSWAHFRHLASKVQHKITESHYLQKNEKQCTVMTLKVLIIQPGGTSFKDLKLNQTLSCFIHWNHGHCSHRSSVQYIRIQVSHSKRSWHSSMVHTGCSCRERSSIPLLLTELLAVSSELISIFCSDEFINNWIYYSQSCDNLRQNNDMTEGLWYGRLCYFFQPRN